MEKNTDTSLPFIITCDVDTMRNLREQGFELVNDRNGVWTFLNCPEKISRLNYASNTKIAYSNKFFI